MSTTDSSLAPRLSRAPTYQAALRGEWWYPGMPQTPGFRAENLRAAARMDGIDIPSGYAFDAGKGEFYDANADHWYSDPRVLGPAAIGATTLGAGLFGAPAAAGASASGGAASSVGADGLLVNNALAPSAFSLTPPSMAGIGGQTIGAGTAATTAGTIANTTAAGTSALDRLRHTLTSANGAQALSALLPLLATANSGGGGNTSGSDELARIQAITEARMRRADPLHQVAVQLAFQRAPISAKNGISVPNVPLPQ